MIIRFEVGNFLSIAEKQEISFVPTSLHDEVGGLIPCELIPGGRLLPAIVIYGANAAGKTNLIAAFYWALSAIASSQNQWLPGVGVRWPHFALKPAYRNEPFCFNVDFIVASARYTYGFEASRKAFLKEWLYSYPNGRRQLVFERLGNQFKWGRSLADTRFNELVGRSTRDNSLFLSAAAQNDHPILTSIYSFFQRVNAATSFGMHMHVLECTEKFMQLDDSEDRNEIVRILRNLGTGISSFKLKKNKESKAATSFRDQLTNLIRSTIPNLPESLEFKEVGYQLAFLHECEDGDAVEFQLSLESNGTRRLVTILSQVLPALKRETNAILLDELSDGLHTKATELIISMFCDKRANIAHSQLLTTTHDTNLLRLPFLRRDQIWFAEKDGCGSSHFFSLADFQVRRSDNLERGYIEGRFGAIPFSGPAADVLDLVDGPDA